MSFELPVFSKCCCCFPLRSGLLVLAYVQLISAVLMFLIVLTALHELLKVFTLGIFLAVFVLLVANLSFSIIFVVGLHSKDYKLLQQYLAFNKFCAAVFILLFLFNLGLVFIYLGPSTVSCSEIFNNFIYALQLLLQFYFLAVVKSMILKLKAEEKIAYKNTNGDARVVLDMPITEEQDVKCEVVHFDSESEEKIQMT